MKNGRQSIAIVGTGPAGLMAASLLAPHFSVSLFEQSRALGPKILLAGKSGLNVSSSLDSVKLLSKYDGPKNHFEKILNQFGVSDWLDFIKSLGLEIFEGTSARYFVRELKAGRLIKKWKKFLINKGVQFYHSHRLIDFKNTESGCELTFEGHPLCYFDHVILALGGASSLSAPGLPQWSELFRIKGIEVMPFESSNAGYHIEASEKFFKECEGKPIKNVSLIESEGKNSGELMVTGYGLEGTPIYGVKKPQLVYLDLKPDLTVEQILQKTLKVKENLNPIRKLSKALLLDSIHKSFLFHFTSEQEKSDLNLLIQKLKRLPIKLLKKRPLSEAISSAGGVSWSELDESMQLIQYPDFYLAGEMIDWDTVTGGFWFQGCVSQGAWVAHQILKKSG